MTKVVIVVAVAAFVLFYIMTSPDQAATITNGAWHWADKIAHGIGNFLNKLVH